MMRIAARATRKWPRAFTAKLRSQSATGSVSRLPNEEMPALLTTTSRPPYARTVSANARSTSCFVGDVELQAIARRKAVLRHDPLRDLLREREIDVGDDDVRAFFGESFRRRRGRCRWRRR